MTAFVYYSNEQFVILSGILLCAHSSFGKKSCDTNLFCRCTGSCFVALTGATATLFNCQIIESLTMQVLHEIVLIRITPMRRNNRELLLKGLVPRFTLRTVSFLATRKAALLQSTEVCPLSAENDVLFFFLHVFDRRYYG